MSDLKSESDDRSRRRLLSATREMRNDQYIAFRQLSLGDWCDWMTAFLRDEVPSPFLAVGREEAHQILIRIYENLSGRDADVFAQAVFEVLQSTPVKANNRRRLYTLLHVTACCLPKGAKEFLKRRLREGVFHRLEYGRQNLHSLVLIASSKYDVDDELLAYVERSARRSKDYDYLLLCQWVLSARGGTKAYVFIEKLLPFINSPSTAARLTRQLSSIAERLGYRALLEWYRLRSVELASALPEPWVLFVNSLEKRLLFDRAIPDLAQKDIDAVSMYAEIRLKDNLLPLENVLTIARLHAWIGIEDASSVLFEIWRNIYETSEEVPWYYTAAIEKHGATREPWGTIHRGERNEYTELKVQSRFEPGTEEVLMRVDDLSRPYVADSETPSARAAGRPA